MFMEYDPLLLCLHLPPIVSLDYCHVIFQFLNSLSAGDDMTNIILICICSLPGVKMKNTKEPVLITKLITISNLKNVNDKTRPDLSISLSRRSEDFCHILYSFTIYMLLVTIHTSMNMTHCTETN